jgi:hypothetical protein
VTEANTHTQSSQTRYDRNSSWFAMDHNGSTTSGSRLTEDEGPNDVLWEKTEGPALVEEGSSRGQAYQASQAFKMHHKVAPNVGPTTGCGNQPEESRSNRQEDRPEKSGAKSVRDDQDELGESSCRTKPQTPPLKERLRTSHKWRSPTPGPSHRQDDDAQSTSQSGVVEIPKLARAVKAAGLVDPRGWSSQESNPGSAASDTSRGRSRAVQRRGGGGQLQEKTTNVAEVLDILLNSLYPASTETNPVVEASGGAPPSDRLPGRSRGKQVPRAAPKPGADLGAVPRTRDNTAGRTSKEQTEVLKPVEVEEEVPSVSQVGKPKAGRKTYLHPNQQLTANKLVETWVRESDKASEDTRSQALQPGKPGHAAAPRREEGQAKGVNESKRSRSAIKQGDPRGHDPRGYAPSFGSLAGPEPTIRVVTQARLEERDQGVSQPGQGRCQSVASTRVSCTTSKLRVVMKGLLADTLPAILEERAALQTKPSEPQLPTGGPDGDLRPNAVQPVRVEIPPLITEPLPPPAARRNLAPNGEPAPMYFQQPWLHAPDNSPEWWRSPPTLMKPAEASSSNGLSGSPGFKPKKLRGFSGKGESWDVYLTHLDIVQRLNQWDDAAMLIHFCSELSETALEFYGSLDWQTQQTFNGVKCAMAQRFGTMSNVEATRHQLENLRQRPDQSLQDLGQQVRRLAYNVYADDLPSRREKEAVRSFMKAISSQEVIRALVGGQQLGSMTQAIELAVRAQEMNKAFLGRPKAAMIRMVRADEADEDDQEDEPDAATKEELVEHIRAFVARGYPGFRGGKGYNPAKKDEDKPARPCWLCQGEGHWSRECMYAPKNWPEWLKREVTLVAQGKAPSTQVAGSPVGQTTDNLASQKSLPQLCAPPVALAAAGHGTLQPQGQAIRLVTATPQQALVVMAESQEQLQTSNQKGKTSRWKKRKAQAKKDKAEGSAPKNSQAPTGETPSLDPSGSQGNANGNKPQGNEKRL